MISWHDVALGDDGTLDTVLWRDGCEHRYTETEYRSIDGGFTDKAWKLLAREVLDDHLTNCIREVKIK